MVRKAAPSSPLAWKSPDALGRTRRRVDVRIIAPVFGGGVHLPQQGESVDGYELRDKLPGRFRKYDEVTPVRGASVRGQLRFWWRAAVGHTFATIDALRDAEEVLWGAASTEKRPRVGEVSLDIVTNSDVPWTPLDVFQSVENQNHKWNPQAIKDESRPWLEQLAYGAFPLQAPAGMRERTPSGRLYEWPHTATLTLEYPRVPDGEVDTVALALDAWLAFGGVGGRTRRGFGAVGPAQGTLDPAAVLRRVNELVGEPHRGLPSLQSARWKTLARGATDARAALGAAIDKLRLFRQGQPRDRGVGRRDGPRGTRKGGRSFWPEPENIRWLTRDSQANHDDFLVDVNCFPRAAFGMPIIFHFQGGDEPDSSTLRPVNAERLASPLILRPYRDPANPKQFRALALVLHDAGRAETDVELEHQMPQDGGAMRPRSQGPQQRDATTTTVRHTLTMEEARSIEALHGDPDVLGAFLAFFSG